MAILFNEDICHDISKAIEKEWLETNGIGGYASSTIIGVNTRRYHGLLMAATRPPLGRTLLLSKLEEFLCIEGKEFPLIVFMVHGENTAVILYQVTCRGERLFAPLFLKVMVMVTFRDYHWIAHENSSFKTDYKVLSNGNGICLQPYDALPPLYLFFNAQSMDRASFWYKNMEYPKEIERGMEAHEDHFSPFALHFDLHKRPDCYVVASTKEYEKLDVFELLNRETGRRENINRVQYICQTQNTDQGLGAGYYDLTTWTYPRARKI